jgi:hypothetical protein
MNHEHPTFPLRDHAWNCAICGTSIHHINRIDQPSQLKKGDLAIFLSEKKSVHTRFLAKIRRHPSRRTDQGLFRSSIDALRASQEAR